MPGTAALLIDLENFYIGREELHRRAHGDDQYEFPVDLDALCQFAAELAGGRRLVVRRAYANFNDRRPGDGERRWDYYLQPQPRFLMEQGIEPVQVFRFPGGSNKNAADMRLAMDATVLLSSPALLSPIELFLLVTGDSDFIPLVLELKRSGAEVVVIGVSGCTKPIFARYCDRFEYFEDLLAARELERDERTDLEPVREALGAMLTRRSPINFAAVKPLLSNELQHPFDPSRFGCDSTGDFMRRYADALGVVVRRGEHDWEIDVLAGNGSAAGAPAARDAPEVLDAADPAAAPAGSARPDEATSVPAAPRAAIPLASHHTADAYRELLRQGMPRCYAVSPADWGMIVNTVLDAVTSDAGAPDLAVYHSELLSEVTDACTEQGMPEAARKVRDVIFQLFKAGCFELADESEEPREPRTDFHWSHPARLAPGISNLHDMTRRTWRFLIDLLARRVEQRARGSLQCEALVDLLAGADPEEHDRRMVEEVLAESQAARRDAGARA